LLPDPLGGSLALLTTIRNASGYAVKLRDIPDPRGDFGPEILESFRAHEPADMATMPLVDDVVAMRAGRIAIVIQILF
jgi:hypothetical protein